MRTKADIIVIGGGPCGTFSAYSAAKLNADVILCEEHKDIGAPRHCAGHLNISSLRRLGIEMPADVIENTIKGAVFHSPSGKEFVLKRNKPVTYVVDRKYFDKHLAKQAMESGVRYQFKSKVKSLLLESGYIKGVIVEKEKIGGMCLNWGCIPTKSLLKNAEIYDTIKNHSI